MTSKGNLISTFWKKNEKQQVNKKTIQKIS